MKQTQSILSGRLWRRLKRNSIRKAILASIIYINFFPLSQFERVHAEDNKLQTLMIYNIPKVIKDINIYSDTSPINKRVTFAIFKKGVKEIFARVDVNNIEDLDGWEVRWFGPDELGYEAKNEYDKDNGDPHVISSIICTGKKLGTYEGLWRIEFLKNNEKIYQTYFVIGNYPEEFKTLLSKARALENEIKDFNKTSGERLLYKTKFYSSLPPLLDNPWDDSREDFDGSIKNAVGDGKTKKIAVLVYISENVRDDYKKINKKGLRVQVPEAMIDIPNTYGYMYRCDIPKGIIKSNLLNDMGDMLVAKNFSNSFVKTWGCDKMFWRDVSCLISGNVKKALGEMGVEVCDLTPARFSLNEFTPQAILSVINQKMPCDYLLLVPYKIYTKKTKHIIRHFRGPQGMLITDVKNTSFMGLFLDYKGVMYKYNEVKPLFQGDYALAAIDSSVLSYHDIRIRFFSDSRDKDGNVVVLKDGVMDDEWVVSRLISRFLYLPLENERETQKIKSLMIDLRAFIIANKI
ncbi:MAG: hypothetical protein PHT32_03275 [Candidatus Omnitrophica bacterium]|nr:hypothetical protein [Candidatus Omnitrophota bacterium]